MKKLLFATTALIATASMASAEVKFSGFGRFGIGYLEGRSHSKVDLLIPDPMTGAVKPDLLTPAQRQTVRSLQARGEALNLAVRERLTKEGIVLKNAMGAVIEFPTGNTAAVPPVDPVTVVGPPGNSNISDAILVSRFRVDIDGLAETDSGVQFEARVRIQADDNELGEAGAAALNGASFSTIFGGLRVDAGNVGGAFDNLANYYGNEPGLEAFIGQAPGVNYSFMGYASAGGGANAIFFNYSIGDFGFAASYDRSSSVTVSERLATGDYVGTAIAVVPNIDRWDMSATYTFASVTAAIAHGQNDLDESLTALTLGAEFGDFSGTLLVADDDVIGKTLNGTAYGLSAAYNLSAATTFNFAYGSGSAESDEQKLGIGVVHDLGGGASLRGGIGQTKIGDGDGRLRADFGAYFGF